MTDQLPVLREKSESKALGPPAPPQQARPGGSALRDFFGRLSDSGRPALDEWEVKYAAIGAVTCLAVAGISRELPAPASIAEGHFDVFGLTTQEVTFLKDLLEILVSILRVSSWPFIAFGVAGLLLDAYLAVRPEQPIALHLACHVQMLLGFLAGLTLVAILFIVLANIAVGLLFAALVVVIGIIVLGIAVTLLGGFTRL